jgi:hypothetical protein
LAVDNSIKENRNLCGYNLWSGTDYTGSVSSETSSSIYFACTQGLSVLESSKEWSSNSDKSIKQTLTTGNYTVFFHYNPDLTKSYSGSIDIKSETTGALYIVARDDINKVNTILKSVSFSTGESTITLNINHTEFTGAETQIQLRLASNGGITYSDNWQLTYS